jgi:uncharacterized protein
MPWTRRRRYDPRFDPYYYGRYPRGSSCLRDACLLETGCCIGEALDGNCLTLAVPVLPTVLSAGLAALTAGGTKSGRGGAGGRPAQAVSSAIGVYQREISPRRPACCRFSPTCSQYAAEAVERHGAIRGLALAAKRLGRCRPGGPRGTDPVPI